MKNYVGRKIRGFRFEDGTDGVEWNSVKENRIGKIGKIVEQESNFVCVNFNDDEWIYPISLIEPHLVDVDTNVDTSLVKCGECNKHYRCTTCDADCGTDGHYVEKEPHLIEENTPEIPQLGEGVLMYVTDDGLIHWDKAKVIAKTHEGMYLDTMFREWKMARPIQ
jgi:hypothetical protein